MDYQKFLVFLTILLAIPIVKADGCGLICPKGSYDLLTLTMSIICNFFTWSFCHVFSFVIFAIGMLLILVFWFSQNKEKRKKLKVFFSILILIFALVLFYPYLKAWTGAAVSVSTDPCQYSNNTVCILSATNGPSPQTNYSSLTGLSSPSATTNHWNLWCEGSFTLPYQIDFSSSASTSPTSPVTVDPNTNPDGIVDVTVSGYGSSDYWVKIDNCPTS